MALTPILLTAMDGFLNNNSININKEFINLINEYSNQPINYAVRRFVNENNYFYIEFPYGKDINGNPLDLPLSNIEPIIRYFFEAFIYKSDNYEVNANPKGSSCAIQSNYFTEFLLDWAYIILATHRTQTHNTFSHAKFIQTLQTVIGYTSQMNRTVNSAVNGKQVGESTFTSVNESITGNLSAVTTSTSTFGNELITTGKLLDFSELKFYGTPHGLMLALIRTNAIRLLTSEFLQVGIVIGDLMDAIIDSPIALLPEVQKTIYTVMQGVTGKKLTDIMLMLNTTVENIETLADLLDTQKIFPKSIDHLLAMVNKELVPLYNSPGVSSVLENIIPVTMARYNVEFRNTLLQVKGIVTTNVQNLAKQFKNSKSSVNLDSVNSFNKPLPDDVSNNITNIVGKGQGDDGLFFITDGVGTACGTTHIDTIRLLNEFHDSLNQEIVTSIVSSYDLIVYKAFNLHEEPEYIIYSQSPVPIPPDVPDPGPEPIEPDPSDYPGGQTDPDYIADHAQWEIDHAQWEIDHAQRQAKEAYDIGLNNWKDNAESWGINIINPLMKCDRNGRIFNRNNIKPSYVDFPDYPECTINPIIPSDSCGSQTGLPVDSNYTSPPCVRFQASRDLWTRGHISKFMSAWIENNPESVKPAKPNSKYYSGYYAIPPDNNEYDADLANWQIEYDAWEIEHNAWLTYRDNSMRQYYYDDEPNPSDYPDGVADPLYVNDHNYWVTLESNYVNYTPELVFNPVYDILDDLYDTVEPDTVEFKQMINDIDNAIILSEKQITTEKFTLTEAYDWPEQEAPDQPNKLYPAGLCAALWNVMQFPSTKKIILGFAESLHALSEKTDLHDVVEVLEKLSIDNQGGDAIIGSLREGQNIKGLDEVGVTTDTRISPKQKNPKPGEIKPSET